MDVERTAGLKRTTETIISGGDALEAVSLDEATASDSFVLQRCPKSWRPKVTFSYG